MANKKSCAYCKYYYPEDITDGYVCVNPDSAYCTEWVHEDDCCMEFEDGNIYENENLLEVVHD